MHSAPYLDHVDALLMPRVVQLDRNLFGAVFSLMKLVPARYILRRALERGDLDPGTVVVETTSGTFGLAFAMQARLLGRPLVLVSDPVIDERLLRRLTDLGARVDICAEPASTGGYQAARLHRLAEIRAELPRSFCPEQYTNPDNPRSYGQVAAHLHRVLGPVDCVVGPVGSGGSMCGTVRALRTTNNEVAAVAVDTPASVLFGHVDGPRPLRGLGNSLMPPNLDHAVFDEVHWCTATEAFAATRRLHREHTVFQGPTSGAAYQVARWWAARNHEARCVVLLPDDGNRYVDTVYDDAWLREQGHDPSSAAQGPVMVEFLGQVTDRWSWLPWGRRSYASMS